MFKKKCKKCGNKVKENYEFCPYCGNSLSEDYKKEDWGMLGKSDFIQPLEEMFPRGLNSMFNFLVKNIDKQFNEFEKEFNENEFKNIDNPLKKRGISVSISTSSDGQPKIRVRSFGDDASKEKFKSPTLKSFSEEKAKKFLSLPREEPKTNIRRLSNKVIYEIEMRGVKKIEEVSIVKLESSIEIRAIAKNKAYFKLIPVNLPIINYNLSKEKLILELKAES